MPTLPASWSLTPTPQFRTVWPGLRKELVVSTGILDSDQTRVVKLDMDT